LRKSLKKRSQITKKEGRTVSEKPWQNRIVGAGTLPASQFQFNPANWRKHPDAQRAALNSVLDKIGWVQGVIVNQTTGNLIDGHARIEEALKQDPSALVPYTEVRLTEKEEKQILLLLDPISSMAETDDALIQQLLADSGIEDEALLAALTDYTLIVPEFESLGDEFHLPSGDKEPFQQLTFTVTDDQAEILKNALQKAKDAGPFPDTGNGNSNGNALARIAESYV
jgi:hypothetical protein